MSEANLSLREKAVAGGRWTSISAIASLLIQFAQLAILGRLLSPADFGLMAMMMIVIGLANLLADFGVSNYFIQIKALSGRLFSALFVLCIVSAFFLAGVIALLAPLVASYYHVPILANLLPVFGIIVIALAISQPFFALLQREIKFKEIAIVEAVAGLVGLLVAAAMALMNYGIWSLISGQLALATIKAAIYSFIASSLIRFEWKIHWHDLSTALRFGNFQMGERLLNFFGWNIDKIIVGRILGDQALGVYSVAYQLVLRPFSILNPIFTRVALPLLSRVQDDDVRLARGYLDMVCTIALISFPIYLLMILARESIIRFLLGEKWANASDLIAILGGLGFVFSLGNPIGCLLLAKGRADLGFYYNLIAVIIYTLAIAIGSCFGIKGVAYGFLIAAAGMLFPLEFILRWQLVHMSPLIYLRAVGSIFVGAFIPLIIGNLVLSLWMQKSSRLGIDIILGLLAVAVYFSYLWFTERTLLKNTAQLILKI